MSRRIIALGLWAGCFSVLPAAVSWGGEPCGDPAAGACDQPNGTPGCNDPVCCEAVCALDPYCCEAAWDAICVAKAHDVCGVGAAPCPWDCVGDDGVVSIEEFLAVIGTWGEVGAPCDFDGDGVGITDFLKVLGLWGPCPPTIHLRSPDPGTVVNAGALVTAHVLPLNFPFDEIEAVQIEYSPDGVNYSSDGILLRYDDIGVFEGLWDPGAHPASIGMSLRVTLTTLGGTVVSDEIPLLVNAQPVAVAEALATGPFDVQFDASGSSDDGKIVNYAWDFGDGTTGEGQVVTHTYDDLGIFSVRLSVTDDAGGQSTVNSVLIMKAPGVVALEEKTECGCMSMDVMSSGAVVVPAKPDPANRHTADDPFDFLCFKNDAGIGDGHRGTLGAYDNGAAGNALTGTGPWTVKFRFEVVADLEPNSEPRLCAEGQRVQRTSNIAGKEKKKKGALSSTNPAYDAGKGGDDPYTGDPPDDPSMTETGECPEGDATKWCDDDYHGGGGTDGTGRQEGPPNWFKVYDGQARIIWLDAPGVRDLYARHLPYTFEASFDAVVTGSLGTCTCEWEVRIKVGMVDGDPTVTQNELLNLTCNPP